MTQTTPIATTVQHGVFPAHSIDEILALYVDAPSPDVIDVRGRHSMVVRAGSTASLATYFNAFPAAYWQRWTAVRSVTARATTSGTGTLTIMRSDETGATSIVEARTVSGHEQSDFELSLAPFSEGGWYWVDVEASDDLLVSKLVWSVHDPVVTEGKVSLGITTFNKPDYCVGTLRSLAASEEVLSEIDRIFVVDQGDNKVSDYSGFEQIAATLGDQLGIVNQPNLGGSGGFSRGMIETLSRDESAFVLLLDDDVELEPESIFRAASFARYCVSPTIVGGHMLDLNKRSTLHAYAEVVERTSFMWGPADRAHARHDFSTNSLRETAWLHTRQDGDYNGWWMCLIPSQVIREIGLSLPVFIKWDDAEYGLRAQSAGFPTVSLPGAALWHIAWTDKDDTTDWQAYFHARNRLIVALLHSEDSSGVRLLREFRKLDIKHLISFQYYPANLRIQAFRDVLAGPESLHERMPTLLQELRTQAEDFPEMRRYPAGTEPASRDGKRTFAENAVAPRGNAGLALFTVKALIRHWIVPTPASFSDRPHVELSKADATWWRVPMLDSVLIDTADGAAASWYVRDRSRFRKLLVESVKLNRQLAREWKQLQKLYRANLKSLTSKESWSRTLQR